ncbi:MAG TPA: J domain-containing protein [Herpetosiphonaceae bacterium]
MAPMHRSARPEAADSLAADSRTSPFALLGAPSPAPLPEWLRLADGRSPYAVLGVSPTDPMEVIEARYSALMLQTHPTFGGSIARFTELNIAMFQIRMERG